MKKITILVTICCSAMVAAQNTEAPKIVTPPIEVSAAFQKDFPKITPHWEKTYRGNDEAELEYDADFSRNSINMKAVYTVFGVFKGLECEITTDQIPEKAKTYLKDNYPKHRIIEAIKVMDNTNSVRYEIGADLEGHPTDFVFDGQGDFLKTVAK